jgi:hypothetical protein
MHLMYHRLSITRKPLHASAKQVFSIIQTLVFVDLVHVVIVSDCRALTLVRYIWPCLSHQLRICLVKLQDLPKRVAVVPELCDGKWSTRDCVCGSWTRLKKMVYLDWCSNIVGTIYLAKRTSSADHRAFVIATDMGCVWGEANTA